MAWGRRRAAVVTAPLVMLLFAWGAALGVSTPTDMGSGILPDGTTLPTQAVEAPASVGKPGARPVATVPTGLVSGIPAVALAAYQRAAAGINKADPSCRLSWELIAAIGRVESDHGRIGGNTLDAGGIARPGIYGIALDGRNKTRRITDTDAGRYDKDTVHDRAVGPMQFIPSTWAVVGVDGDGDGRRNPQDIDDAALAAAVYLCSGRDDLSTEKGQRASIYRYNHSNDYVDLVLAVMQAYIDGDAGAGSTDVNLSALPAPERPRFGPAATGNGGGGEGGKGGTRPPTPAGSPTKSPPTKTPPPASTPNGTPAQSGQPTKAPGTASSSQSPSQPPSQPAVTPSVQPTELPGALPSSIGQTLTYAQAQAQCLAAGIPRENVGALKACIDRLMNP